MKCRLGRCFCYLSIYRYTHIIHIYVCLHTMMSVTLSVFNPKGILYREYAGSFRLVKYHGLASMIRYPQCAFDLVWVQGRCGRNYMTKRRLPWQASFGCITKKNEWTPQNLLFPFHLILCTIADAMLVQNHRFCLTFTLTSILRFMTLQPQCWACQIHQSSPCLLGQNWSTAMPTFHKRPLQMGLLGSIKECRCWWYFALCYAFCSIVCMCIYLYVYNGIIYHFIPHPIHRYKVSCVPHAFCSHCQVILSAYISWPLQLPVSQSGIHQSFDFDFLRVGKAKPFRMDLTP